MKPVCGCTVEYYQYGEVGIDFCPMHKAAPDLLAACQDAIVWMHDDMTDHESLEHELNAHEADMCVLCQLNKAIKRATGG